MRAVERVSLVELFRFLQFLYKNFNLEFTFPIMELIIFSQFMYLSISSPIYFTLSCDLKTCSLHFKLQLVMFLSFLRCPKRTHSVLPKCKDNLLSTSRFDHDSITSDSFCDITSGSLWANSMALSSALIINLQSALTLVYISFT